MTSADIHKSQIRYARLAGFMYLVVDAAFLSYVLITARCEVPGNFAETAHRITGSELLYRIGLSSGLIASLCTVFLAMGLYVAVKPIDNNLALLALAFRMVEAALFGVQVIVNFVVLKLYLGADYVKAFDANQLSVVVNLHSAAHFAVFNIAAIFFSIGSILFFYLLFKSTYIPKLLSGVGVLGSVLIPIVCFGSLISPQYAKILQFGWLPVGLAEILVGLWLLFKSVNLQPQDSGNAAATV
jgi:NADH:ubiquinone oxidoreductase subunit K